MKLDIRALGQADRSTWVEMREALWPETDLPTHIAEIDDMLGGENIWGFVAEIEGAPVGFAEIAIRPYANGCDSRPVPFLEGIWVKAPFRRQGIGARLIGHIETFLTARGFREIGSDTELENHASQNAHGRWGFRETERVVYFRKLLRAGSASSAPDGRAARQMAGTPGGGRRICEACS
jgi:aminoglycoside 6'-N-acetyltransferase I